jgi:hypothetical protein
MFPEAHQRLLGDVARLFSVPQHPQGIGMQPILVLHDLVPICVAVHLHSRKRGGPRKVAFTRGDFARRQGSGARMQIAARVGFRRFRRIFPDGERGVTGL